MQNLQDRLKSLSAGVRSRPAMFFGEQGSVAILQMIRGFIDGVLRVANKRWHGTITVSVRGKGRRQSIVIEFAGLASGVFSPLHPRDEDASLFSAQGWEMGAAMGACDKCSLDFCDGKLQTRMNIRDGWRVSVKTSASDLKPGFRVELRPVFEIFTSLGHQDFYGISGYLREQSILRPSLPTRLCADLLNAEISFFYREGMKSLLLEEDYARWPAHDGCLSFKGMTKGMQVEGHLRFLHAGVPYVRNYVNFRPTHGGAHLEGLGDALLEVFPDPSLGCRISTLVTNPDSGKRIRLPRPFIGALHLQTERPRYYGPTKDILMGDEVREFVRQAATETLKQQWHVCLKPGS